MCYLHRQTVMLLYFFCLSLVTPILAVRCPALESGYDADVLILGAGMSGISAAKSLHENGVDDFMIIEAGDRMGGRMRSKEFGGIRVELGEQWIFGIHFPEDPPRLFSDHNDIQRLIERCGIKGLNPGDNEAHAFYDGKTLIDKDTLDMAVYKFINVSGATLYKERVIRMKRKLPDISVRQALTDIGWVPDTPFKKLMEWDFFDFYYQQLPETASLFRIFSKQIENFGQDAFIITDQRGSEHLIYCMAEDFGLAPHDPRLKLGTRVYRVRNGDSCVCVDTVSSSLERKTYCGKRALVTFSIGVLQSPLVQFVPRLPRWKQEAINMFRMNHIHRLFLKYKEPFWDNVTFIDHLDEVKGRYVAFQPLDYYRYNISQSAHVIVSTMIGEQAEIMVKQPISEIKHDVKKVFEEMYPDATIPDPEDILVTDWKNDPLYLGSAPNKAIGATDSTYNILAAPVGRLFFSGDGIDKLYSGQLHGAYYSGVNAGLAIANATNL